MQPDSILQAVDGAIGLTVNLIPADDREGKLQHVGAALELLLLQLAERADPLLKMGQVGLKLDAAPDRLMKEVWQEVIGNAR